MKISVDENIKLRFKFLAEESEKGEKAINYLIDNFNNVKITGRVVNPNTAEEIVGIEIDK